MKKKIFLTGGAGYIGSVLTKKLLDNNYDVKVLDNFFYDQQSLIDCAVYKNFELINGDIRDYDLVKKSMQDADVIIPLASLVGAPICKKFPKFYHEINFNYAINIIEKKV